MLTDVDDNSLSTTDQFVREVSESGVHTTIIGLSSDFKSNICERLNEIKGFNYFCAVETEDLNKYLFENFDWTFFPSCYDMEITLKSDNVRCFEVFGSPDSERVNEYNSFGKKELTEYVVTRVKTGFPSEITIHNGTTKTTGGLFLVKLSPQNQLQHFSGTVVMAYKTIKGEEVIQ